MVLGPTTTFSASTDSDKTPFGIYNSDTQFQTDADKIVVYTQRHLGSDVLDTTGLGDKVIWSCFEEATLKYSEIQNTYNSRNFLHDMFGSPTGSLSGSENRFPISNSEFRRRLAQSYGNDVEVGGIYPVYSASFTLRDGVQSYNVADELSLTGGFHIQDVYHFSPTAAYRFFDTTSALNYLSNEFSFESYSPETIFYLLPIWEDLARAGSIETSQRVRRSNYAWDLVGNILRIYPVPTAGSAGRKLWVRYKLPMNPFSVPTGGRNVDLDGVTNISNIPFGNLNYSKLNSIAKNWIRQYCLALAMIILGEVRSKFKSYGIPGSDTSLNGEELKSQGIEMRTNLENSLKEQLEATTIPALLTAETEKANNLNQLFKFSPMMIITG